MDTVHDGQRTPATYATSTTSPPGHVAPIPDAVIMVDSNGRILLANDRAEALFGYTAHELGEQPLNRLLPETFHETHDALVAQYLAVPLPRVMAADVQVLGRHRDGRLLPLEISFTPLHGVGPLCVLCVIRDVTAHADAEHVKQEFLRLAAHTLQTPLTALRGNVDTLLLQSTRGDGPKLAERQQETLEEIRWATERLETLAATLLEVTRLHAGQLELQQETHDLVALVRRVVERVRKRAHTPPLTVRVPTHVLLTSIDARLIEQTLEHLLDNAMKSNRPERRSRSVCDGVMRKERRRSACATMGWAFPWSNENTSSPVLAGRHPGRAGGSGIEPVSLSSVH